MEPKKIAIWAFVALLTIFVILFGVTAASTASEASQIDSQMKAAVAGHTAKDQVKQQLVALGHSIVTETPQELRTLGPSHSMIVYSTALNVHMTFDQDGKAIAYTMDRK